ncbi:sensor histidine kinase, partial [Neptunomonas sp.]|uniref:sensor histidine kinase n=1 Tax=Neptunomonas sp. TaxID=1971898 RepID=UPI003568B5F8
DSLKDDFMSSVTHELRTPLTSIRALSEIMLDDDEMLLEQRQQFLSIVVAETERLSRLVNQVLDMAKIEAGHAEWRESAVDMVQLVQQAAGSMSESYRERGAVLTVQGDSQVQTVQADSDRLMQVMLNLLSNAVKFVPQDNGRVGVTISDTPEGVTVAVQDNGPGIAAEQQSQVFDKFRQVGDMDNHPQGTGLGLPISKQIIEHFGGRLWLESVAGEGACFSFFIPRLTDNKSKE